MVPVGWVIPMSTVVPAGIFPDLPLCSFLSAQKSLNKLNKKSWHFIFNILARQLTALLGFLTQVDFTCAQLQAL